MSHGLAGSPRRPRASGPSAARRGRARRRRCRTRWRRSRRSPRRPRPATGMSSQAARTGEENRPDCEQKWQSSGQPPVFTDTMPSTSTSGPHQRIRTSWASASSVGHVVVGELAAPASTCASSSPTPRSSTCSRARQVVDGSSRHAVTSPRRCVGWSAGGRRGSLPHRRCRRAPGPARRGRPAGTRPRPARPPRGSARPAAGRPGSRGRGRCCGRRGPARPATRRSTTPAQLQAAVRHASRVSAVWLRVPRSGGDDEHDRRRQPAGQVGDRGALVVVADEQAAGALDQHEVGASPPAPGRRSRRVAQARRRAARRAGPPRPARAGRGSGRARAGPSRRPADVPRRGRRARRADAGLRRA